MVADKFASKATVAVDWLAGEDRLDQGEDSGEGGESRGWKIHGEGCERRTRELSIAVRE